MLNKQLIFILVTILLSGCSANNLSYSNYEQLSEQDKKKVDFLIASEHDSYDSCFDHNTSRCPTFFSNAKKLGLINDDEYILIYEEDTNNPGKPHNPDYSKNALEARRTILNRYFNYVKKEYSNYPNKLTNVDCSKSYCKFIR
ncbi:MAG: hypothetical protein WC659_04825 [Patescibacteria group bacterium]